MTEPTMKEDLRKELRGYAWAYFDRHAEQRLKTFNFYLILCGAIIAGLVSQKSTELLPYSLLRFLLSFVSFIFWKLDVRNHDLTKHSEEALKLLEDELGLPDESEGVPHRCKLFRREEVVKKVEAISGKQILQLHNLFPVYIRVVRIGRICSTSRSSNFQFVQPDNSDAFRCGPFFVRGVGPYF
jgi:hypothetical protein